MSTQADPIRVLFVCTANICRSAFAELLARHMVGAQGPVTFTSAGTYGLPAHPVNPEIAAFLPPAVSTLGFASRRVTGEIVADAELILTMEAEHRKYLLEEFPGSFRKALTLGQAVAAAGATASSGRTFIAEVARRRPPVRPDEDVADPFRRGQEANARAAAQIAGYLETVIPVLLVSREASAS